MSVKERIFYMGALGEPVVVLAVPEIFHRTGRAVAPPREGLCISVSSQDVPQTRLMYGSQPQTPCSFSTPRVQECPGRTLSVFQLSNRKESIDGVSVFIGVLYSCRSWPRFFIRWYLIFWIQRSRSDAAHNMSRHGGSR